MSVPALTTEGIGPGGSILYAMTGGLDISHVLPPSITDIRSGHLNIDSGLLSLKTKSGSADFMIKGPELRLVVTS